MSSWIETTLGDEFELLYGKALPEKTRKPGNVAVYGSNGVVGSHTEKLADGPGIIIGRKGSVGEVAFSDGPYWAIDTTYYVKPKNDSNWRYLYYLLLSLKEAFKNTHSTVPGLNRETVYPVTCSIAPRDEQNRIAAVLWKIQQAIEVETNLIRVTRELKAAVMRKLFTEGLYGEPQKETEIGMVPESWAIKEMGQVTELARGRFSHRPRNEPRFYGGQMPFIQTGDVVRSKGHIREHSQTLNDDGVAISRVFPTGTILITIAANIGYSGVLNFDSACPDSLVAITPNGSLDSWFLQFYLETQQPKMDELAPRGTQKNINIQFLQPWKVPIPVLSEQQSIAKIIQTVKSAIETHENKAEGLKELFQNLLCSLMSGTVSVPDLDSVQSCVESQGIAT